MPGIFTRKTIAEIMSNDQLTPEERTDQVFSLYGRALDADYITKGAAQAAQTAALDAAKADWEKGVQHPDPKESDVYKALQGEFDAYKAMQTARTSEEYKGIKPKFFEMVYGMIDRKDGAKPVKDQLADIRTNYDEILRRHRRRLVPGFVEPHRVRPKGQRPGPRGRVVLPALGKTGAKPAGRVKNQERIHRVRDDIQRRLAVRDQIVQRAGLVVIQQTEFSGRR